MLCCRTRGQLQFKNEDHDENPIIESDFLETAKGAEDIPMEKTDT